jgi:hypothetical protein
VRRSAPDEHRRLLARAARPPPAAA